MESILWHNILQVDWYILLAVITGTCAFVIVIFKVFRIFRPPKLVKVNCWFCNQNTKVPFRNKNCFSCPHCDQYNGFDQYGNYNRPIPAQHHEELNRYGRVVYRHEKAPPSLLESRGMLCEHCNINQAMKLQQLAAFVPYNEDNFEAEVEHYEEYLEELYPLCDMCEGVVGNVLRNQDQELKLKLIGRWLQESKPSSPVSSSSSSECVPPLPFYIILLRLAAVLSAVICLLIDLRQTHVVDVKAKLRDVIPTVTDIPPIGRHRSSIILAGLVCVILAALLAGKNRLRHIDAILPFVWLLSLSIGWSPPWLSLLSVPQFIAQLLWIQNMKNWLPWKLYWHLGVSISCVVCSVVFLISRRVVLRKKKYQKRGASKDTSAKSSLPDEPQYQEDNDVAMASDTVTPPPATNHDRHDLDESLNSLTLDQEVEEKSKREDTWTAYTTATSAFKSSIPSRPHDETATYSHPSWTSRFLKTFWSFQVILLRLVAVLAALSCLLIDLHKNGVVDMKRKATIFKSEFPPIGTYRCEIVLIGLGCTIIAAILTWKNRVRWMNVIALITWLFSLTFSWKPPWLSALQLPQSIAQSPWILHIHSWLPWQMCWHLGVSISCLLFCLILLFTSIKVAEKRDERSQSIDNLQNAMEDASVASSVSSESLQPSDNEDVAVASDHVTQPPPNHNKDILDESLNTLSLGPPAEQRKKQKVIWSSQTKTHTSSSSSALKSSMPSTSHKKRHPIIHPAKLQPTRSKFIMGQQEQRLSSRRGPSKWYDS